MTTLWQSAKKQCTFKVSCATPPRDNCTRLLKPSCLSDGCQRQFHDFFPAPSNSPLTAWSVVSCSLHNWPTMSSTNKSTQPGVQKDPQECEEDYVSELEMKNDEKRCDLVQHVP